MSDPVTNVEIEDVLSSIRRLVSEGDKPRKDAAQQLETAPKAPERLVLTPALRVDEPRQDTPLELPEADGFLELSDSSVTPEAAPEAADPSPTDRADLEATIAELEAAVTEQPDEWEPDGSEVEYKPNWDRTLFEAVEEAVGETAKQEVGAGLAAAMNRPVHDPVEDAWHSRRARPTPTEDHVEEAAVETDDTPIGDTENAVEAALTEEITQDDVPAFEAPEAAPAVAEPARVAFRHLNREVVTPQADLTGGAADAPAPQDERVGASDDEELRQMVLEIVRQELNGKLGERITRNVRKLVRREIMRVLNAQDFD